MAMRLKTGVEPIWFEIMPCASFYSVLRSTPCQETGPSGWEVRRTGYRRPGENLFADERDTYVNMFQRAPGAICVNKPESHISINIFMMTYILSYQESNPRPRGLCAKPLIIVITYRICDYNNCIFSEYKIFGISRTFLNIS